MKILCHLVAGRGLFFLRPLHITAYRYLRCKIQVTDFAEDGHASN
jgi:hypothetical protein